MQGYGWTCIVNGTPYSVFQLKQVPDRAHGICLRLNRQDMLLQLFGILDSRLTLHELKGMVVDLVQVFIQRVRVRMEGRSWNGIGHGED